MIELIKKKKNYHLRRLHYVLELIILIAIFNIYRMNALILMDFNVQVAHIRRADLQNVYIRIFFLSFIYFFYSLLHIFYRFSKKIVFLFFFFSFFWNPRHISYSTLMSLYPINVSEKFVQSENKVTRFCMIYDIYGRFIRNVELRIQYEEV